MTRPRLLALGLAAFLLGATAGCSTDNHAVSDSGAADAPTSARVLLLGDSVAAGEAAPLTQAFAASGVEFQSIAAEGGGNVVGPFSDKNWRKLPGQIAAAKPTAVVYQITTYDWGSQRKQRAAYQKLLTTVAGAGARLFFVTMPPIRPDAFYRPHMGDLAHASAAARSVVSASAGKASLLDAGAVWTTRYQRLRDGKVDRSSDGIHTCPQGAARFTNWLVGKLADPLDFSPAPAKSWANTGWSADKRFVGC